MKSQQRIKFLNEKKCVSGACDVYHLNFWAKQSNFKIEKNGSDIHFDGIYTQHILMFFNLNNPVVDVSTNFLRNSQIFDNCIDHHRMEHLSVKVYS